MLRRANQLMERARERIRQAAESDPDAWPPSGGGHGTNGSGRGTNGSGSAPASVATASEDGDLAEPGHTPPPSTPAAADERPHLGSPAPGAEDLDSPGPVSGPPTSTTQRAGPGRARRLLDRATATATSADSSADDDTVPGGLRVAAAWSWRLILVGGALWLVLQGIGLVLEVFVPLLVALLLAALLQPAAAGLVKRKWPRSLAALAMLLLGILVVAGIITLVVDRVVADWSSLTGKVSQGLVQIQDTITRTFPITQRQLDELVAQAQHAIGANQGAITSGALSTAGTVTTFFTGILLTLIILFFFLKDGRSIWLWLIGLMPVSSQAYVDEAARRSWRTLTSYVRATVAVALIDAVLIGIGLLFLGVPLALPLAALIFIGAFIPIIGSFIAGTVAVLVALVSNGFVVALIALGVVVLVMQLEGHIFSPLLLGRAVRVHPLAVILGIATGLIVAGIFGALIAVPIIACLNVGGTYLVHRHDGPRPPEPRPQRAKHAVTAE